MSKMLRLNSPFNPICIYDLHPLKLEQIIIIPNLILIKFNLIKKTKLKS